MDSYKIQFASCMKCFVSCTKLLDVFRLAVWTGIILPQDIIALITHKVPTLGAGVVLFKTFLDFSSKLRNF